MKIIRSGTFETNSSSTHSYTMNSEYCDSDTFYQVEGKTVRGGDFGWEEMTLDDSLDKLNYVAQYIYCIFNRFDEVYEFKDYIQEEYGLDFEIDQESISKGYIDHQSLYDTLPISKDNFNKKEFEFLCYLIFNDYNQIKTDNDNH